MNRLEHERICGVETEFGCLVMNPELGSPEDAVEAVKNAVFDDLKLGLIDMHSRDDVFEPAQSGGFLVNGARLYIDAVGSHLEYATAECRTIWEVIANDRAGHKIINRAIEKAGVTGEVAFYNNSVDHFGGHTFGCHENYMCRMTDDFFQSSAHLLMAFLATRQIFAGVGRVGGHRLSTRRTSPTIDQIEANPIDYIWVSQVYQVDPDPSIGFQLSQRADHILKGIASRVRFNRAMINPKWEHFYSHDDFQRLHLLFGEANQSDYAYALKLGTTRLVISLVEDGLVPYELQVYHPVRALQEISRDETWKWATTDMLGEPTTAMSIQRQYLDLATIYKGRDAETDWVLENWAATLDQLEKDPMQLSDKLDWVAKYQVVQQYQSEFGCEPGDDSLISVDMEYHSIDPETSLFHALKQMGKMQSPIPELDIIEAQTDPPSDTRAAGRSAKIREVLARKPRGPYAFDWSGAATGRHKYIDMPDPFETYLEKADD